MTERPWQPMPAGPIRALVVLGPAVCQGCQGRVWWRITAVWAAWTDTDGRRHRCPVVGP